MSLSVLLVDDDTRFAERLARRLTKEGHDVQHAATGATAERMLKEGSPDVLLLDLMLPDMGGLELLEKAASRETSPTTLVMTAHASVSTAVEAMRLGALDYLTKPIDLDALLLKLKHAGELIGLRSDLDYLLDREQKGVGLGRFIGSCPAMVQVYEKIREVAKTDNTTVLVTGPSGTGKEVAARAVHALSARCKRPLMQIDCTAIPVNLMESELFGHERGAFTGADRAKKGLLELANGGTLFLDEIGDMAPELQGKLLRVLQERQFRRVGGTHDLQFDVRVIAATNQELEAMCKDGRFRQDLYFRLKVFELCLPPLSDRGDDIVDLAEAFLLDYARAFRKGVKSLDIEAREALLSYSFPGNVRELKSIMEQAVILSKGPTITRDLLSLPSGQDSVPLSTTRPPPLSLDALGEEPLLVAERELIRQALLRAGGNKRRAAEMLGISRFALQRKVEKLTMALLEEKNRER